MTSKKKINKTTYQICLEPDLAQTIKSLADANGESFSAFCRNALQEKALANYWNTILHGRNIPKKLARNPVKELMTNVAA
jgi:hypothetical protein